MALIALGVTGGIGAYKAVEVARGLQRRGHEVVAVMTHSATRFVGPVTFEAITRRHVITDQFEQLFLDLLPGDILAGHFVLGAAAEKALEREDAARRLRPFVVHGPAHRRYVNADLIGEQLGLTKDWVVRIVKQVGNYGESFDRNVGPGSKLGISRGLNRLWTKGGIQYAPPIR